ncbi:integrin alpha pat-2-like [Varroa jacobsoni]|uniref:integrin alpha pat-2-like n=1 Tax=Varroa jacobsoni TaxID=62625 RepID=UPI000BFAAF35|nr:integrin alpha pat-2-like [Varroa jacobsoni]
MTHATCSSRPLLGIRSRRFLRSCDYCSSVMYRCPARLTQKLASLLRLRTRTIVLLVVAFAVQLPGPCLASEELALNLDLSKIQMFGGEPVHREGQFGASAVLHRQPDGTSWALFGAPRGQLDSFTFPGTDRTGAVYQCEVNKAQSPCRKTFDSQQYNETFRPTLKGDWTIKAANMSLGLTMTHDDEHNNIAVCAPRQILEMRNPQQHQFFIGGACYVFTENFHPFAKFGQWGEFKRLDGLTRKNGPAGTLVYVNGMRQLGMSIDIRDKNMLVGAPGFEDWSGESILFELPSHAGVETFTAEEPASYAGYSVANIYIKGEYFIVQGVPRGAKTFGQVVVSTYAATQYRGIKAIRQGTQMGEYFGAAVAVADINGDGKDDLLVGAPMYSPTEDSRDRNGIVTTKLSKGSFDQGRVYVYLGREDNIDVQPTHYLQASNRGKGARFGWTIVRVGDFDKDGCDEVAIGAPFEERENGGSGAVYLFKGCTKKGDNQEYPSIRIVPPAQYQSLVRGFGFAISKGNDLTGNGYPDVAIGAVLSGHGFVYQGRPVVLINATIKAEHNVVPEGPGDCNVNDRVNYFCTKLTACVSYEHPARQGSSTTTPRELPVKLRFQADPTRSSIRGLVQDQKNTSAYRATATYEVLLGGPKKIVCIDVNVGIVTVLNDTRQSQDILQPVEFRMKTSLVQTSSSLEFCAHCPVVPTPSVVTSLISYKVPCNDPLCKVRLHVTAQINGVANRTAIALGRSRPLELKIEVSADKRLDTAFNTFLIVRLREGLSFNNPDKCKRNNKSDNSELKCLVDSQLPAGASRQMIIKLDLDPDLDRVKAKSTVGLDVELITESKDENAAKNRLSLEFPLVKLADVGVSGSDVQQTAMFNRTTTITQFQHVYTVTKYHDSTVELVHLHIDVPVATKKAYAANHHFIKILSYGERDTHGAVDVKCTSTNLRRKRSPDASPVALERLASSSSSLIPSSASLTLPTSSIRELVIDCDTFTCKRVICRLGPFIGDQSRVTYAVNLELNITKLIDEIRVIPEHIAYRSRANISVANVEQFSFGAHEHSKVAQIQTGLFREGRPLGPGIPWWWLLIAVLLGLLMVALIVIALYKCGFFRRTDREALDEMQKEPQSASPILLTMPSDHQTHIVAPQHHVGHPHSPINNMVDHTVDKNDNNTFRDSRL